MPVVSEIYQRFPDGTPVDFNAVFDVIDTVQNSREIKHKDLKRFMNQFRDANRTNAIIWSRYDEITNYHSPSESQFIRNPTLRIMTGEADSAEREQVDPILELSEYESHDAWHAVAGMISLLKKENQKLVLTAYYLCGADRNKISRVYDHQDRWAVELCRDALDTLARLEPGVPCSDDTEAEAVRLIQKWEADEATYEAKLIAEKNKEAAEWTNPKEPIDDLKVVMGLL